MATVLIVEDDPTMAEMVAYNLRRQDLDVRTTGDGAEGLRLAKDAGVELIVLDLMLPSLDGLQFARELRRVRPEVPILMLTARTEEDTKLSGFDAGVDDYLTKPFSMDELVARVKALLRRSGPRGAHPEAPAALAFGDLRINANDYRVTVAERECELRPKEFALLTELAGAPGRAFTRLELAERVWGYTHLGDTRTIDTHVKHLRRKVEGPSAYTYIDTVRGVGYRFRVRPKEPTP